MFNLIDLYLTRKTRKTVIYILYTMKQLASILVLIILMAGCQDMNKKEAPAENVQISTVDSAPQMIASEAVPEKAVSDLAEGEITWSDSLLKMYMAFANTETFKQAHTNNFTLEWVYDNTVKTDTGVFDVYRIGHEISRDEGADTRFIVDQWIYLDTLKKQLYEYDAAANRLSKWWTSDGEKQVFYPVYELSSKTTAFVVNFYEVGKQRGIMDTLFDVFYPKKSQEKGLEECRSCVPKKWKLYDTSGIYKLIRNETLEKEARCYFDTAFYVYGTNGYARSRIKNIALALDPCITNIFAFCLDNASLKSIGHPLFCSTKLLPIHYGKDYSKMEKSMDSYYVASGDYSDSIKTKIMGNVGNFYFYYHDDFSRDPKNFKSKCKFPDRGIRLIDNKKVSQFWNSDFIDLFGIECD